MHGTTVVPLACMLGTPRAVHPLSLLLIIPILSLRVTTPTTGLIHVLEQTSDTRNLTTIDVIRAVLHFAKMLRTVMMHTLSSGSVLYRTICIAVFFISR